MHFLGNIRCLLISIHALLAESDRAGWQPWTVRRYFYPRSPCGERPLPPHKQKRRNWISIHALLAESDVTNAQPHKIVVISIHALLAESDYRFCAARVPKNISIHALLAESDPSNFASLR